MEKKVFILGCDGMLGRYMYKYLSKIYDTCPLNRNDYDVLNDNFYNLKKILTPNSILINCIGIIPQKIDAFNDKVVEVSAPFGSDTLFCKAKRSEASNDKFVNDKLYLKINCIFPNMLSLLCNELNIKFIHITTDCVFTGKKGNYTENDIHDETNIYGLSKSLGEPNNCTVIRTSIIGEELKGKKSLLEWVKSNDCKDSKDRKEINGYTDHYWNGVTCLQLAKITQRIIDKNLYWNGVKHFFSPTSVSKYELIELIILIYNLNIKVNKCTNTYTNKTLNTINPHELADFKISELKDQISELEHFNLA
jgi:dTDP-4-dehydrorhamnose reductase